MLGKNTILKAIHNCSGTSKILDMVWMLGKNTILKAIHNMLGEIGSTSVGVNAG